MGKLSDYVYGKAARIGSAAALAAVLVGGASVAPAAAQGRQYGHYHDGQYCAVDHNRVDRNDRDYRSVSSSESRRIAAINGYAQGFENGVEDRNDRRSSNYQRDEYRRATEGYDRDHRMSVRDYQNAFRQGYAKGYSDGYYGRNRSRDYDRSQVYDYRNSRVDPYRNYPSYRQNGYGNNGGYHDNRRGDLSTEEVARRAAQQGYYDGFYRGQYDLRQGVRRPNPQGHGAYQFAMNGWDPEWGSALTFQQSYRQYFMQGYQDGYGRRSMNNRYSRRWW